MVVGTSDWRILRINFSLFLISGKIRNAYSGYRRGADASEGCWPLGNLDLHCHGLTWYYYNPSSSGLSFV